VNTGVLLRMVRILSVLIWRLNKRLRLVGKTALFDMDSYTIKRTFCKGNMSTICLLNIFYVNNFHILLI